jgi:hypothetical protein
MGGGVNQASNMPALRRASTPNQRRRLQRWHQSALASSWRVSSFIAIKIFLFEYIGQEAM